MSDLIKQTMAAGEVVRWQREAGLILVGEVSAPINVQLKKHGREIFYAAGVGRGVKVRPVEGFDEAVLHNDTAGPVALEVFITGGDVDVQISTGLNVAVGNTAANPVPVDVLGVALTANNFVWKSDGTLADATAAPSAVAAQFAAASAARRSLRVKNTGAVAVAIGSAGVAYSTAAIVLMPGELWMENEGAGCAWYAVTETAAGAIAVQTVAA